MKTTLPRITISAPHRSSGKSTVTIGLCAALNKRGLNVRPFKKGPDFIDPMWHEAATGNASHNLDQYMFGDELVVRNFRRYATGGDISLIEGNMGLYDGMDLEGSDSTAGLSRLIKSPVILAIDCYGMTRGIAPLVKGFESFEPDTRIVGVILNKVKGARHEKRLKAAIERYCGAEVLGALPHESRVTIEMRHLGLVPLKEDTGLEPRIEAMREVMEKYVDIDRVIELADSAEAIEPLTETPVEYPEPDIRIGVAMDSAFTFYYPENLDALRMAGAELVPFSPMNDPAPPDVDGLYIGGGFPEVHMEALERNADMREAIKKRIESGIPVYAECGGLMYLCRDIEYEGKKAAMVGAIPGDVVMSKRPAGHGYVRLRPTGNGNWPAFGDEVVAHEFHHSSIEGLSGVEFGYEMMRGKGIDGRHDGAMVNNILAGYAHMHATGTPDWAGGFAGFVRKMSR
jgi:cobyrinic acid a,c-diamide synthase